MLGQRWHSSGLGALGFLGWSRGSFKDHRRASQQWRTHQRLRAQRHELSHQHDSPHAFKLQRQLLHHWPRIDPFDQQHPAKRAFALILADVSFIGPFSDTLTSPFEPPLTRSFHHAKPKSPHPLPPRNRQVSHFDLHRASWTLTHLEVVNGIHHQRLHLGHDLLAHVHQHILLRLQWGRGGQVSRVFKHQCGADGQHSAGEQASEYDACFQLNAVQHRGFRALPGV